MQILIIYIIHAMHQFLYDWLIFQNLIRFMVCVKFVFNLKDRNYI
jgi:hypothetical protein